MEEMKEEEEESFMETSKESDDSLESDQSESDAD